MAFNIAIDGWQEPEKVQSPKNLRRIWGMCGYRCNVPRDGILFFTESYRCFR